MSEWTAPHPRSNPGHSWHGPPKAKLRACVKKSSPAAQFVNSMPCNVILPEDPWTPRRCIQTLSPSKQISSALVPLDSGAINPYCPQKGDSQNLRYNLLFPQLSQASNTSHQDWLKDLIELCSVLYSMPQTTTWIIYSPPTECTALCLPHTNVVLPAVEMQDA